MGDINREPDALMARAKMLNKEKGINILVEDSNKEYLYESLFESFFPKNLDISYTALGGKKSVLNEAKCQTLNMTNPIFLVDTDFDELLSKTINLENLVYTEYYNIESCLFCEEKIMEYLRAIMRKPKKDIQAIFNFNNFLNTAIKDLEILVVVFASIQHSNSGKSLIFGLERFLGEKSINMSKVEKIEPSSQEYLNSKTYIKKVIDEKFHNDYKTLICGKYLIKYFIFYTTKKFPINHDQSILSYILNSNNFNPKITNIIERIKGTKSYKDSVSAGI